MAANVGLVPARFENVNLLRAFAALSVVVYHVIQLGQWTGYPDSGPFAVLRQGWYGVDLFFVISGFVIAYSGLVLYRADPPTFGPRYWKRRLTRILPLYLVTLFLYAAFFAPSWSAASWALQLFTHLTFTHSFSEVTHGAIDGPNWSLAIEMHFYMLFAAAVAWIDRTSAWKIAVGAIVVSWAWRAAMWSFYADGSSFRLFVMVTQLPGVLDFFAAGIVLAKLVLDGRREWFRGWLAWLLAAAATGAAAGAIFVHGPTYWSSPWMVIFWRTLLALVFMCATATAIALPQSIARRWLRPLDYLGETSYGIYLWHLFAINLFILALGWRGLPALGAVLALTVALAAGSWQLFEKPALRRGRATA